VNEPKEIVLDSVQLRDYQEEILYAVEELGYRKIFLCLARRGGKDYLAWWIAIRYAIKNVCLVTYALPTFGQAKKCIFEAIDSNGRTFISLIPKELISRINVSEQKIVLTNGSIISCVGTENHDTSIRGSNPKLVVLSEFAYMDADVLDTVRPILANNGGTLIVVSTPFSKNHFFDLMCMAKQMPDWYVVYKNVYETKHISDEVLAEERAQMTKEKFAQEYECSFESGEGFYYTRQLETIRQKGQITNVEWDPSLLVYVSIDIGVKDATTMVFYSVLPGAIQIRILDCYSNTGQGVEHYIAKIQEKQMKGWRFGAYFAPHDLMVREWGSGAITRFEKARQLGVKFTVLEQILVYDGIENVWTNFSKFWIDQNNCKELVKALENYRREWDDAKSMFKNKPLHDIHSNYADSIRYMCQSLPLLGIGLTDAEWERQKNKALYGTKSNLPRELTPSDPYRR